MNMKGSMTISMALVFTMLAFVGYIFYSVIYPAFQKIHDVLVMVGN